MLELDSTLRHNSTPASTEKLDSPRQPSTATRRAGAWSQPRQARQELDRLDRQGLDNGLDGASTARQLDSQGSKNNSKETWAYVVVRGQGLGCVDRS